jgi:serine/threonine-protein kinase
VDTLPRVIDRYELLAVLGAGAFATVYRARHVHTNQPVAVKIIGRSAASTAGLGTDGTERALIEARTAATVQHENVVRILDCGKAGDEVFIVMELTEGPTLADVIQAGPLAPARAIGIAVQLLEGLGAAHARGIVHRDVKPANVILVRNDRGAEVAKLLDFGVSKQLNEVSMTRDGASVGTPGYMAPELFGGARNADARSDVYAVAITLYEMLSGALPFAATTYEQLVVKIATQPPVPLLVAAPDIAPSLAVLVERGMARDRGDRFGSAQDFADALRSVMHVVATLPGAQRSPSKVPRAYEPTLDMRHTPQATPAPVVHTTTRHDGHGKALVWVVAILGVLLVGIAGAGVVAWQYLAARPVANTEVTSTPPVSATTAAKEPATPAELPSIVASAPKLVTPLPTAVPTQAQRVPTSSGGITFKFPAKIVGQARPTPIDALAQQIIPSAQRCRPGHGQPGVVARVQLFVQQEGTISIAKAASEPGDEAVAECLAALFKEAATPQTFAPGGGGIVTVEARLDPR